MVVCTRRDVVRRIYPLPGIPLMTTTAVMVINRRRVRVDYTNSIAVCTHDICIDDHDNTVEVLCRFTVSAEK